jgi:flagellar biosynthesis/type III secretory pathway protein FliH
VADEGTGRARIRPPRRALDRVKIVLWVAVVVLLGAGAAVGGYARRKSSGEDLDAAREAGQQAGQAKGAARGAERGYAEGFKEGRKQGFEQAYEAAHRRARGVALALQT